MYCHACKHVNDGNAKFCSNCGSAQSKGSAPRKKTQSGSANQYPHAEGIAAFNALVSENALGRLYGYCAGLAVPVLGVLGGALTHNFALLLPAVIVGIVVASIVHWVCTVREAGYRALPGAVDAGGHFRCVHCGGRGLWQRTPYQSNTTISACSGCKTELFRQ